MEALTLTIAGLGVLITLASTPLNGFIAFLGVLLLYPDYLRVSLGSVDISACRIIITFVLLRCLADREVMRRFQWKKLDSWMLASMVVYACALSLTMPLLEMLENRAGFVMDTFFVYLATRFVIVDRASAVKVFKAVAAMVVLLSGHALVETFAGRSLYEGLGKYCAWAPRKGMEYQMRFGLHRAMGPPGETILFGLSLASLLPFIWMLRHEPPPWRRWVYFASLACIAGVIATISSGPYLALMVILGCLAMEFAKGLLKPAIVLFFLGCAAIEVLSNRHFYHVLADLSMEGSGWYRARLIDVAIAKFPEYWLYGYGYGDPGWGPMINALSFTDVVNDFVMQAILYGGFGLAIYVAVMIRAAYEVVRCHAMSPSPWIKSLCWALVSSLTGLFFAFWSVSLFGQMTSQFYMLLGMHGALAIQVKRAPSIVLPVAPYLRRATTTTARLVPSEARWSR